MSDRTGGGVWELEAKGRAERRRGRALATARRAPTPVRELTSRINCAGVSDGPSGKVDSSTG